MEWPMRSTGSPRNASLLAAAAIVALVGIGGLVGAQSAELDGGTASVEVVSAPGDRLAFEPGRFGTAADYLRLPDLVVAVTARSGTPRIHYRITLPKMGVDRHDTRLIRREGRLRVPLTDVASPPTGPVPGTYTGRVEVRVQNFSTDSVIVNRTVRVEVPE
jgi:hypothetical protein